MNHQDDDTPLASAPDQHQDPRIVDIEFLRMGMQLEHLDAAGGHALQLGNRRLTVVGMDGGDGHLAGMAGGQRDDAVIICAGLLDLSRRRLIRAAEPHAAKARDGGARGFELSLIFGERGLAMPQVHMRIKKT